MSIYLAAIFGFCALTTSPVAVFAFPAQLSQVSQETPPPEAAPAKGEPGPSQPAAEPQAEPTAVQEPPTKQPEQAKPESKTKVASKKRRHHKSVAAPSSTVPEKKVVRNGGTADPAVQLAPGMSVEQASSQRQNTSQLLTATDSNLKEISSRQLNSSQQDSVSQIRKYMEQANAAEKAGDVQRAHNLASKALLLSDDLAKH